MIGGETFFFTILDVKNVSVNFFFRFFFILSKLSQHFFFFIFCSTFLLSPQFLSLFFLLSTFLLSAFHLSTRHRFQDDVVCSVSCARLKFYFSLMKNSAKLFVSAMNNVLVKLFFFSLRAFKIFSGCL